jgi:hypothetical protein
MTKEQVTHITNHIAEDTSESISRKKLVMTPNRPPSCDLPPGFYRPKLKPCPLCGATAEQYSFDSIAICTGQGCKVVGPNNDQHGHKWNSIPRRSEVLELLRLMKHMYNSYGWDDLYQREKLVMCAEKLRKEMGK